MPEPTKIPRPFADSGDKNSIPDSSGSIGFASWQEGFPAITGTPFAQGGVAPKRADFNGIFNALSAATVWNQQGGVYAYDATTDYEVGNVVLYSGDLYICITANGPSSAVKAPTDTTVWSKVMTAADAAALYLPLSGGTLNGDLIFSTSPSYIRRNSDAGTLALYSGSGFDKGGELVLYGKDTSYNPGEFQLRAKNGVNSRILRGTADGTLTWGGLDVATIQTGTWTPTLIGETVAGTLTYSAQGAMYIKIGRWVFVSGEVNVSGYTTHPTGRAFLGGLPFAVNSISNDMIIRGKGGDSNSFEKLLNAGTDFSATRLVIRGIVSNNNIFDVMSFNTSATDSNKIKLATSGTSRGSFTFSGSYYASS